MSKIKIDKRLKLFYIAIIISYKDYNMSADVNIGLDIGSEFIGFSHIDMSTNAITAGTYIMNNDISAQKNRSDKRNIRKQTKRTRIRRNAILSNLMECGIIPYHEFKTNYEKNIYLRQITSTAANLKLRIKALDSKIPLESIGAIAIMLSDRRGFSGGKIDADPEKASKFKKEIYTLSMMLETSNYRTAYELIDKLATDKRAELNLILEQGGLDDNTRRHYESYTTPKTTDVSAYYGIRLNRAMAIDEFDKIFYKQQEYYPDILTDELINELRKMVYFQRPLQLKEIGECTFEKTRKLINGKIKYGKKRLHKTSPLFQEFRIIDWVMNNVTYDGNSLNENELTEASAILLKSTEAFTVAQLNKELKQIDFKYNCHSQTRKVPFNLTKKVYIDSIAHELSLSYDDSIGIYNELQSMNGTNFNGTALEDIVSSVVAFDRNILGGYDTGNISYTALVRITSNSRKSQRKGLANRLKKEYLSKLTGSFDLDVLAMHLASFDDFIDDGYCNLSATAIRKILNIMYSGAFYATAVSNLYGKNIIDEKPLHNLSSNNIVTKTAASALHIVNKITEQYKNINRNDITVVIEKAGGFVINEKQKDELDLQNKKNEEFNEKCRSQIITDLSSINSGNYVHKQIKDRGLIKRLKLCIEQKGQCPYCLESIHYLDSDLDIDHIIPESKSFDSRMSNLVLAHSTCNHVKKANLAYHAFHDNFNILRKAWTKWYKPDSEKYKRLTATSFDDYDGMKPRSLHTTQNIIGIVANTLKSRGFNVELPNPTTVATIRHNYIINEVKDRSDLRNHGKDALACAMFPMTKNVNGRLELDDRISTTNIHDVFSVENYKFKYYKKRSNLTALHSETALKNFNETTNKYTIYKKVRKYGVDPVTKINDYVRSDNDSTHGHPRVCTEKLTNNPFIAHNTALNKRVYLSNGYKCVHVYIWQNNPFVAIEDYKGKLHGTNLSRLESANYIGSLFKGDLFNNLHDKDVGNGIQSVNKIVGITFMGGKTIGVYYRNTINFDSKIDPIFKSSAKDLLKMVQNLRNPI